MRTDHGWWAVFLAAPVGADRSQPDLLSRQKDALGEWRVAYVSRGASHHTLGHAFHEGRPCTDARAAQSNAQEKAAVDDISKPPLDRPPPAHRLWAAFLPSTKPLAHLRDTETLKKQKPESINDCRAAVEVTRCNIARSNDADVGAACAEVPTQFYSHRR